MEPKRKYYYTEFLDDGHISVISRECIRAQIKGIALGLFGSDAWSICKDMFVVISPGRLVARLHCTEGEYERFVEAGRCGLWGVRSTEYYHSYKEE